MPTFDIVSEVDMHEMSNAVDQAQREMSNRFDFKGVDASFELTDTEIIINFIFYLLKKWEFVAESLSMIL